MEVNGETGGRDLVEEGVRLERLGRSAEAEALFTEAAEQGNVAGLYNCGLLAERRGDLGRARLCFALAHDGGHPWAANNLGVLLFNAGDPEALTWLRLAEAMGHPQAAGNVRLLLANRAAAVKGSPESTTLALCRDAEGAYRFFQATGSDAAMVRAISLARQAVQAVPEDDAGSVTMLSDLRDLLSEQYGRHGRRHDLQEAIATAEATVHRSLPTDPRRPEAVGTLLHLLRKQFTLDSRPEALLEAVTRYGRPSLEQPVGDNSAKLVLASNLCGALFELAQRDIAGADLDEIVAVAEKTVALAGAGDAGALNNLAAALLLRGYRSSSVADVSAAIEALSSASADSDSPHLGIAVTTLARALDLRATLTDREEDRRTARLYAEHAQQLTSETARSHPEALIAAALAAEAPGAVAAAQLALDAAPGDHRDRSRLLLRLAEAAEAEGDPGAAVTAARQAVTTARDPLSLLNGHRKLGTLLLKAAESAADGGRRSDAHEMASEAVESFDAAVSACGPRGSAYALTLVQRFRSLMERHRLGGPAADREAALADLRTASGAQHASAPDRLLAARIWSGVAWEAGDLPDALAGAVAAVNLLQEFGWMGLDRDDQERGLHSAAAMPRDAAALAIATGQLELAVELLERGRSVLWRSAQQVRGDLTVLAAQAPGLAEELEQIRSELAARSGLDREARLRLATQWSLKVAEAQAHPSVEGFLEPPRFQDLAEASAKGPVVIVNISTLRCDAIVLRPKGGPELVPLSSFTSQEMDRIANTYALRLEEATAPTANGLTRDLARHATHDTLEWLWEHIASPVLAHLELPAPQGALPRIWWCPTASLSNLPLHAAGRYPRSTSSVQVEPMGLPYLTVSSYTSTLASLVEARKRPVRASSGLLAVAVTDTGRGHPVLPFANDEVVAIAQAVDIGQVILMMGDGTDELDEVHPPGTERMTVLIGEGATSNVVRKQLSRHGWAHFACHGGFDLSAPSTVGLSLRDDELTVLDIAELRLEQAELAFLSACHTRRGGALLPDEAIHPAGAFRTAGFRHVVATLGRINDEAASLVVARMYQLLSGSNGLDATGTATALHHAVAGLRAQHLTDPTVWVPFVHDGP
ncbi:CHAT domain-containing protein [Kitasatospora sp. NPDC057692]|uniref:CHAT domain-containing protein n=1 Tax=Kitasatospora sp. NPDC057692 TaxID=3346215 RepID=UPI00368CE570